MKKLKVKTCTVLAASRISIIGNYMLRRQKHSTIEAVAPKEEEEEVVYISVAECRAREISLIVRFQVSLIQTTSHGITLQNIFLNKI
jgi:hypothetical protein